MGAMIEEYAPNLDPLALVSEFTPPTYIFHTLGDKLVLPIETLEYIKTLIKHNVNCEYHLFNEGEHGISTLILFPAMAEYTLKEFTTGYQWQLIG